ncbi:leucyl aminopeptidase [Candidatus Aerophobetes bacterium]|uniref:Probable cytosol aminopeptidase n=1 Tax=Aerophobetes bacterium TaxID=2030807 RepID=A0A2A4X6B4_UNCAE|nr:MAG: leucyl aminopeptidase [Candidatus Aerophobetes bacterium]
MKVTVCAKINDRPISDVTVVPFFTHKKGEVASAFTEGDLKQTLEDIAAYEDFSAKQGSTLLVLGGSEKDERLLFLGLGSVETVSSNSIKEAIAAFVKRARGKSQWKRVNVVIPKVKGLKAEVVFEAVVEGLFLSHYLFEDLKSVDNRKLFYMDKVTVIGEGTNGKITQIQKLHTGVTLARDLVNRNAKDATPSHLASVCKNLAKKYPNVKTKVLEKKELETHKMGLLLAVGESSADEPKLIMMEYLNGGSKSTTMVVGKGVTFDTGGLNLKPTNYIEDMKCDMGGAAAAIGLMKAVAEQNLKVNLIVLVPTTENAIGSLSYKPGDVYTSYLGKTVEITNTDAEGRLILADALAFGQKKFKPDRIIDLATLTGAIVVALGSERTGYYCTEDKLAKKLEEAATVTSEKVWRMPLDKEYASQLKSPIADLANCSKKRMAGSITAALFLKEFIEEGTPWIHLDIAGTAYLDGATSYHMTQATGVGVRLLNELVSQLD